jgi:hypothetical protein
LEGERRIESITAADSGTSRTTQASNLSCCIRSGTSPFMSTVSIPNCLKHSTKSDPVGSSMSTRATRAEVFLLGRGGARTAPEAFCMALGNALPEQFWPAVGVLAKAKKANGRVPRSYYPECTAELRIWTYKAKVVNDLTETSQPSQFGNIVRFGRGLPADYQR